MPAFIGNWKGLLVPKKNYQANGGWYYASYYSLHPNIIKSCKKYFKFILVNI